MVWSVRQRWLAGLCKIFPLERERRRAGLDGCAEDHGGGIRDQPIYTEAPSWGFCPIFPSLSSYPSVYLSAQTLFASLLTTVN